VGSDSKVQGVNEKRTPEDDAQDARPQDPQFQDARFQGRSRGEVSEEEGGAEDPALAVALLDLSDRLQADQDLSLDQAIDAYPNYEQEIRQLWGTLVVATAVGKFRVQEAAEHLSSDPDTLDGLVHGSPSAAGFPEISLTESTRLPARFGDFELLEELGRGGMGVVYRARQISLNRVVALKLILRGSLASRDERLRFRSEAEAAACLDHPNIARVYQFSDEDAHPFICMQYIEGGTLIDFMRTHPAPRVIAGILAQVADAIQFAHDWGVLHRDLKPSNILIDQQGDPHVVDFGLAKHHVRGSLATAPTVTAGQEPLTNTGAILGTPAYMAPESAGSQRGDIGVGSDVYSLGAILYFCLAGQAPFVGKSTLDTLLLVREQEPIPPRQLRPGIDRDLERVALKCLQKPLDLRYSTAGELANDLRAYINNEPMVAASGAFSNVLARTFRETHHASILENWGLLWMWHSLVLLTACLATDLMLWNQLGHRWSYFLLWSVGFGTWAFVFWILRRRLGPVSFVERQIAHLWAASMIALFGLFFLEIHFELEPLKLAPILGIISGMVFLVKAGMLSGTFYLQATALFLTTIPMALYPDWGHTVFGLVAAACFFFPGLKYYRRRLKNEARQRAALQAEQEERAEHEERAEQAAASVDPTSERHPTPYP